MGNSPYEYPYYPDYDQWYTAKYSTADGALLWERAYPEKKGDGHARANSLAVGKGFVVVTGEVNGDFVTIKYLDAPAPQTTGAQVFAPNKARLNGAINPNGVATSAAFEYGTDPRLASFVTTAASAIGDASVAVPIGVTLFTLSPGTTYYYRATGTGSGVTLRGEIMTFTTPPADQPTGPVARPTPRPRLRR
jgi:hypothetical protein